ncbi:MAG: CHAT domain-containing protein [Chloroflexi bacterium]|nr:CHAT domain-containing protein [Chloroflexota bacterium]
MSFYNLDLAIESVGNEFLVNTYSPECGPARGRFTLPFHADELVEWSRGISETLARQIGAALYSALFQNDILYVYQDCLRHAAHNQLDLRLRLNLDPLANRFPWELLYNKPARQFLALDSHLSIVRQPTIPEPLAPLRVNLPLRLLVVAAQPSDADLLDIASERAALTQALQTLPREHIRVEWLEQPSLETLRQAFLASDFHILHFIGHGRFRAETGESQLQMVNPSGTGRWVSAEQLAQFVRAERTLRVVLLNACESARGNLENPFSSLAAELIKYGDVSAAIAMQYPISNAASICFTRGFYEALARGESLDASVTQGRLAIDAEISHFEWATPSLYLHAADGELIERFDDAELPRLEPIPDVPERFVGRAQTLEKYRDALATRNFAIIQGMAGVGKTTLGAVLAREHQAQGRSVYWISFDPASKNNGEVFVWEFAGLLQRRGKPELWELLKQETVAATRNPMARFNLLLTGFQDGEYTLCFDDLHFVQEDPVIRQLFGGMQKQFQGRGRDIPAKFIVMTRDVPAYMQYLSEDLLEGLNIDDTRALLQAEGIRLSDEQLTRLYAKVQGNPQFLRLALLAGLARHVDHPAALARFIEDLEAQRNVRDYLLNGMYAHLNADEMRILNVVCVFNSFVTLRAVQETAVGEAVSDIALHLEDLIRASVVLEKKETGDIGLHALVRDWGYRALDEDLKRRLNQRAGAHFEAERDYVTAAHHYSRALEFTRAARVLLENADDLMSHGQLDGLREELSAFTRAQLDVALWVAVCRARGEALSRSGSEVGASAAFREALARTSAPYARVELYERLARSLRTRGEFAQAIAMYEKAVEEGTPIDARQVIARAYYGLANAFTRQGELAKSIAYSEQALQIAGALNDRLLAAEAKFERGVAAVYSGETAQGIEYLKASLATFELHQRADLTANALLELGLAHHNLEALDTAASYYERALELYEKIGDLGNVGSVLNNLGDLELGRENYTQALIFLERAQKIALARDDTYLQTLLYHTKAETCAAMHDHDRALAQTELGLKVALQFEYFVLQAALHRTRGEIFVSRGDRTPAQNEFNAAREILASTKVQDMSEWLAFCTSYGKFLLSDETQRAAGCDYLRRALEYAHNLGATNQAHTLEALLAPECVANSDQVQTII